MAYQNLFGCLISISISVVHAGGWCHSTGDTKHLGGDSDYCDQGCCHKSGTINGEECCGLNTGTIVGIVFGCVIGVIALIIVIRVYRYCKQRGLFLRRQTTTATTTIATAGGTTMTTYPTQHVEAPHNPPQQFGQNQPYSQPPPNDKPQSYDQTPPQQYGQPPPQQYGQPPPQQYGQLQPQQYGQPQPYSQPSAPSLELQAPPLDQKPPPSYDSVVNNY